MKKIHTYLLGIMIMTLMFGSTGVSAQGEDLFNDSGASGDPYNVLPPPSAGIGSDVNPSNSGPNAPIGSDIQPSSGSNQSANLGGSSSGPSALSIAGIIGWFIGLLNYVVQFIIGLALIAFLYGIFRMVFLDASNEAERVKARKFMIWGICALFVMVSVWGLVNVLKTSVFGGGPLIIPEFK